MASPMVETIMRLNRTFMELKYEDVKRFCSRFAFKSHLYGIEIYHLLLFFKSESV